MPKGHRKKTPKIPFERPKPSKKARNGFKIGKPKPKDIQDYIAFRSEGRNKGVWR